MITGECQGEPTPAGTDIQHGQIRTIEAELGGNVPLLGNLCLFQRCVRMRKIGAGILAVAIEEQTVETAVQVIVVRDILARAMRRVVLINSPLQLTQRGMQAPDRVAGAVRRQVHHQQLERVIDSPFVRYQPAIHVSFADSERRIGDQSA